MQRRAQFDATPDDLAFFQRNDRSNDFDLRLRPRPHADQFLERPVVFRPAIRVAGAVFRDCSDVNRSRANRLCPAHCYPDCRPEYYRAFQELIRVGTRPETQIEIITPVITLKKSEIIRRGIELGAPLHLTWSCYQNEDTACGVCDSCLLRLRAFSEAAAADPIPYRQSVSAGR